MQDENAKTILLNVPLEVNLASKSTSKGQQQQQQQAISPKVTSEAKSKKPPLPSTKLTKGQRVRSASVGRDKRSDFSSSFFTFVVKKIKDNCLEMWNWTINDD